MSTKAPRITDLDEDFAGDPLRHLARYCLPDHLVNLQGLAFVAGYNVDISSRLLDDGGLTYQTVVHRVTADGELHGSEYIIGMAEYHGAGWTMIPQGTGTLPDAAVGVEVAVRRTPITTLIRRIGSNINDWDFADSGDPQQDRRIRAEHDARHAGGTVDQIIEAETDHLVHARHSDEFYDVRLVAVLSGFDVEVKNRLVGDDHECTLTARRVDQDGDPVGQAIVVVSAYRNGEWTIDRSRTGILEGDAALRPADTGELVNFLFERINDWDLADEFIEEDMTVDDVTELTETQRTAMRRKLAQTANLPVDDLRDLILSLPARQPVTDEYEGPYSSSAPYSSQREHIAGWLEEYSGRGYYNRQKPTTSSKAFYGRFKCAPGLLWLAEALGENPDTCRTAIERSAESGSNPASQCGAFRKVVSWPRIVELLDARLAG
ncbi:hypothetical protein GII30_15520 [Gordonia amarae]|uniref:Uncharacterized protein n=2 Tax=Gordonia amarae TaxID=36821 RepID=G7GK34_9ACTN|nr:hypothetical protein [Gordonia amarae]MCS3879818.1 hypothetical protein [Gordonia amarae]QHN18238.1 hypothetical protein GII35_15835 [Gordonia amarae]QHN22722.1 hypothetical protein GII34_15380 [Gordonia amarae]QHN31625.1 hypothetical protein GII32_15685 [Gordonia amarae]QHN40369.1 hypothetical protein GII30_15520 [Gordonia amarae]